MPQHADLPDAGQLTHFDLDLLTPAAAEKAALAGTLNTPSAANQYVTANHLAQHVEPLQGYQGISGFLHWQYDAIDGTLRTIIPNGPGDVVYSLRIMFVLRTSGGGQANNTTGLIPTASFDLWNSGSDILTLSVAANGAVTIQRTGGTLTYRVGLWLLWT